MRYDGGNRIIDIMKSLIDRLRALLSASSVVLTNFRNILTESRSNAVEARLEALEKALDIQAALNGSIDTQIKLVYALLERVQKTLRIVIIGFIFSSTLALLAIAAVLMR